MASIGGDETPLGNSYSQQKQIASGQWEWETQLPLFCEAVFQSAEIQSMPNFLPKQDERPTKCGA